MDDDLGLSLKNEKLSEADRLTLENDALRACVQKLAGIASDNTRVMKSVEKCREVLSLAAKRRKAVKRRDEIEQACFYLINHATQAKIANPTVLITRYGKNDWEAYVEGFEDPERIGVGEGTSPLEAIRDLLGRTRSYEAKCKRAKPEAV